MNSLGEYFSGFFEGIRKGGPVMQFRTATQLIFEFGQYIDMLATANPHRLHHVYEWGLVGDAAARLFELYATPTGSGVLITYRFLPSRTANGNGQVFVDKARVMESGDMVTTNPDGPVPIYDEFRVGPFTFKPGGDATTGTFAQEFITYFSARSNVVAQSNISMHPSNMSRAGGMADGRRIIDSIVIK